MSCFLPVEKDLGNVGLQHTSSPDDFIVPQHGMQYFLWDTYASSLFCAENK